MLELAWACMAGCGCFRPRRQLPRRPRSWRHRFPRPSRHPMQPQRPTPLWQPGLMVQQRRQRNQSPDTQRLLGMYLLHLVIKTIPRFFFFCFYSTRLEWTNLSNFEIKNARTFVCVCFFKLIDLNLFSIQFLSNFNNYLKSAEKKSMKSKNQYCTFLRLRVLLFLC